MTAPSCPISNSQIPYSRLFQPLGPAYPAIPPAIEGDLPSLIRTTNLIRDALHRFSSSLVVNNVFNPRPPSFKAQGDTIYPDSPVWRMKDYEYVVGYVYHKEGSGLTAKMDKNQRVYVQRTDRVNYQNKQQEDKDFTWSYSKKLDAVLGQPILSSTGQVIGSVGPPSQPQPVEPLPLVIPEAA